MDKINATNERIAEALKLLDEAAKNKKNEIQAMLKDKYEHIKDTINGFDSADSIDAAKQSAADAANRAKDIGEENEKYTITHYFSHKLYPKYYIICIFSKVIKLDLSR